MLTVYAVRCEHDREPLAVSASHPRFSWRLSSDLTDVVQKQSQIQVARDVDFHDVLWDTGVAESVQSHLVPYAGPSLQPQTRYFYRVRAVDNHGEASNWSETACFETAMPAGSWHSPFIGMDMPDEAASSKPMYFRTEFDLAETPESARVYATALGLYELQVNGHRVGDDFFTPGWTNYRERLAYQVYDVTPYLHTGRNAIAAIVGPGWYKGDLTWKNVRNLYGERSALSLLLRVRSASGNGFELSTGPDWKVSTGPITYAELYHGEHYDSRLEQDGWALPDFDDSEWEPAVVREFDVNRVVPDDGAAVRKQERLAVEKMFTTPRGETVLDFGQNLTGWVEFSADGKQGDRVALRHAEILDADGNFYTDNLRSARATDEYLLSGSGRKTYEPHFTFHGFRYVMIESYPGTVNPADFTAVVLHSNMENTLSFECSNPLLNGLHHNILWGWKGNALDVPTDCPQRDERLGWTGDAQVFIGTASYLTDTATFFRKWLRDLASDQLPDGGVPFVIPDVLRDLEPDANNILRDTHSSTGWGDAAVVCPWTIYARYGDRVLLEQQYESMKGWVEFIRARAENGVLWNSGFHFGDWVALDAKEGSYFGATPNDLTATAYYAFSAGLLARAAQVLGRQEDAEDYGRLAEQIVEAFRMEFITPSGRVAARTQTAHILSLVFGLVPPRHRERVTRDLVSLIEENGGHLTTGFLGTPFLCRALAENGRLDLAYEMLLKDDYPSWLYQVKQGATTVWEHWDGMKPDGTMWSADMNSFNHYAYGAIGEWMYQTIGGISPDPDDPAFHTVVVSPQPGGGITHSRMAYEGTYGEIVVEWTRSDNRMHLKVTVPPNSSAKVVLAQSDIRTSTGVEFTHENGVSTAVVGSGTTVFDYFL